MSEDKSIIDKILKKAKSRLDACEVCFMSMESKETQFASNKLKSSQGKGSRSVAVRGFKDGKMGFYASSDLTSVDEIVDATVELTGEGSPYEIELPSDFGNAKVDTFDYNVANLSPADLADIGRDLIGMVREYNSKFLSEAQVSSEVVEFSLANTKGGRGESRSTVTVCVLSPQFTDESGFTEIYEYDFSTHLPPDRFRYLGERVARKLQMCEKSAKAATGEYEILLMPKGCSILGTVTSAMNSRSVLKGFSPWKDKLGEIVADERFEIIDDPLASGFVRSQPFDDEGMPSRKKALIEKGKLSLFYNDLYSAAKLGQTPTGNAFRAGNRSEPRAAPSTMFIKEGEKDFGMLVEGMKRGIMIDQIMGAHTSSYFSGDFNVNIDMGWLVENGEIVGRVKDCMLAGNIFTWIKDNLVEIGRGAECSSDTLCLPPMLFSGGKIAAGG